MSVAVKVVAPLALGAFALACDAPTTYVDLDNDYPATSALVIFQAAWQAVSFQNPTGIDGMGSVMTSSPVRPTSGRPSGSRAVSPCLLLSRSR